MLADQNLDQPVRDQLMQGEEFLIRFKDGGGVFAIGNSWSASLQGFRRLLHDGVGNDFAGHLPKRDEAIHGGRETDLENAEIAGGAWGLEVEIERTVVVMAPQQNQNVQPIQRIDESEADIDFGLVNPLDWLNVLVLLRSHQYN